MDAALALGFIVGSMLAPPLARRVRPAFVMAGGLRRWRRSASRLLTRVAGDRRSAVLVIGSIALLAGPRTGVHAGHRPDRRRPRRRNGRARHRPSRRPASELGGALGIAILGSIGTAIYRGQVTARSASGVPSAAATATRDTLGGAVGAAGQLPDDLGAALLGAARDAFGHGLHVVAAISAVVAIGSAVLAASVPAQCPVE